MGGRGNVLQNLRAVPQSQKIKTDRGRFQVELDDDDEPQSVRDLEAEAKKVR